MLFVNQRSKSSSRASTAAYAATQWYSWQWLRISHWAWRDVRWHRRGSSSKVTQHQAIKHDEQQWRCRLLWPAEHRRTCSHCGAI